MSEQEPIIAAPTIPVEETRACPNCGAERLGPYCHACGQHYLDARLTLRVLWREFAERFLKLERGLWATLIAAFRSPGDLARRYVEGQRRPYVNPLSFLLIGAAFALLLLPLYAGAFFAVDSIETMGPFELGLSVSGVDPDDLTEEQRAEMSRFMNVYMGELLEAIKQLNTVLSFGLALLLALALRLFFSGGRQAYTLAETLVFTLYVVGLYSLISPLVAIVFSTLGSMWLNTAATSVLLIGFLLYGIGDFYQRSWGSYALGLLSFLIAYVVYVFLIVLTAAPLAISRTTRILETMGS